MDFAWLAGVTGFALTMAATPGPNNTIAAASGASYGVARSLPLMAGIGSGVAVIMLVVTTFGAAVVADPRVGAVLKWLGIAYLLWLAWKIAMTQTSASSSTKLARNAPLSFLQGAAFQFVNPKLWVMVSGTVVTYGQTANGLQAPSVALLFAAIFGSLSFLSTAGWATLGASVGRLLNSPRSLRVFNVVMAVLLLISLIPVVFE